MEFSKLFNYYDTSLMRFDEFTYKIPKYWFLNDQKLEKYTHNNYAKIRQALKNKKTDEKDFEIILKCFKDR